VRAPLLVPALMCATLISCGEFRKNSAIAPPATALAPAPSAAEFFPLREGRHYKYHGTFNDKNYDSDLVTRQDRLADGTTIYYFVTNDRDTGDDDHILLGAMFGLGAYGIDDKGIFTLEVFWRSELPKLLTSDKQPLFPSPLTVGATLQVRSKNREWDATVSVEPPETITTKAGRFSDCLKLKMFERWKDGTEYTSYVWLAPNIGVIKWQRPTGRLEELTELPK